MIDPARVRQRNCRPTATYRIQLHEGFDFAAAAALAPQLRDLGVSHLYCSPILAARAGSLHGYDVVDYDRINPELGGEEGFRALAAALAAEGIGIVLDIVPNHMAVGGGDNRLWLDLLAKGRASRYAAWFDIEFDRDDPELAGRILAPFLGESYATELADGRIRLVEAPDPWTYGVRSGEHLLPIRTEDHDEIARRGLDAFGSPEALDALIARQHWRLAWWRTAGDAINWRRFFDIIGLAAIRMEVPEAFEAAHRLTFRLYEEGSIDGVRVDHVDGLADPAAYCTRLRARLGEIATRRPPGAAEGPAWIVVEKILAGHERLPPDWPVDGTTGYDFMNEVSLLQHDPAAATPLGRHWAEISGRSADFEPEEESARREQLDGQFDGQRDGVARACRALARGTAAGSDLTQAAFRRAVTDLMARLRVYRSYATGRPGSSAGSDLEAAWEAADACPTADRRTLHLILETLNGRLPAAEEARVDAVRRFHQLSAPIAAKAVEDTAFYRYGRLLSRNDVGFDPGRLGLDPSAFCTLMHERAGVRPASLLATATHDHKRGEDVRARLAVVSENPEAWIAATRKWSGLNAAVRPDGLDPADEYLLYQMLAGAWPTGLAPDDADGLSGFADRLAGWQRKALREAKLRSAWAAPERAYEDAAERFLRTALDPAASTAFLADMAAFLAHLIPAGCANALVQTTLRLTCPGVPDIYQGTELWDFSLVDPDNRRPVDHAARAALLGSASSPAERAARWRDGAVKQALIAGLLRLRRRHPGPFGGSWSALQVDGRRAAHVLAFLREGGGERIAVAVALRIAGALDASDALVPPADWWGDTVVALPSGSRRVETIGGEAEGGCPFGVLPVSVWIGRP